MSSESATPDSERETQRSEPGSSAPARRREYAGAGFFSGVAVLVIVGILLVAVVAQNAEAVPFSLLWFEADVSLAALLLGTAVIAVLVSELVGLFWRRRRRRYRTLREEREAES